MKIVSLLKEKLAWEKKILIENKESVHDSNIQTAKIILISLLFIFVINLLLTFLSPTLLEVGYLELRSAYLIYIIVAVFILCMIFTRLYFKSIFSVYAIYTLGLVYSIVASAFISPNYVSVTILALLFQLPVLFMDFSIRINLMELVFAMLYIITIFPYKEFLSFSILTRSVKL